MKYTIFDIGGEKFGISVENVTEVLKSRDLGKTPELPAFVTGLMDMKGRVIPVMDLRERFGLTGKGARERIILVRLGNDTLGLRVDDVSEIAEIPQEQVRETPPLLKGPRPGFVAGMAKGRGGRNGGRTVILLDPENLLTQGERLQLETLLRRLGGEGRNPGHPGGREAR